MRKAKVKNKHNLNFKDISRLEILNRTKIGEPSFWRNDAVSAWCTTGRVGNADLCDDTTFWIGIYDNGNIKCNVDCYGGMCSYNFKKFFDEKEIEREDDLLIQEKLLDAINKLIDTKVLGIPIKI